MWVWVDGGASRGRLRSARATPRCAASYTTSTPGRDPTNRSGQPVVGTPKNGKDRTGGGRCPGVPGFGRRVDAGQQCAPPLVGQSTRRRRATGRLQAPRTAAHRRKPGDPVGANFKALQNMLGHTSAGLTLDRYGHLYDSDVNTVGHAINEVITVTCGHGMGTWPAVSRHLRAVSAADLQ